MKSIHKFLEICPNCYWFDGKHCDIHYKPIMPSCVQYVNDTIHHKRVKWWILNEPVKAIRNWNMLDDLDREKFKEIWGDAYD